MGAWGPAMPAAWPSAAVLLSKRNSAQQRASESSRCLHTLQSTRYGEQKQKSALDVALTTLASPQHGRDAGVLTRKRAYTQMAERGPSNRFAACHKADRSHAVLQDPVAVGFGGRKFDITGLDSKAYYCLLTSASQQAGVPFLQASLPSRVTGSLPGAKDAVTLKGVALGACVSVS